MTRIIWTERATAAFEAAYRSIAGDSNRAAERFEQRVYRAVARLERFPLSGRMVPERGQEALREVIVGNYRIFYTTASDEVVILSVHHAARRFPTDVE